MRAGLPRANKKKTGRTAADRSGRRYSKEILDAASWGCMKEGSIRGVNHRMVGVKRNTGRCRLEADDRGMMATLFVLFFLFSLSI